MAEQLTEQQRMAVENRGGRLLVSAAAGSGKTKVLVDRLMLHLKQGNGKTNIDDFLIITYTKAAASELRAKIAKKLNEILAEQPHNKQLQRQLQRLYLAKISTVHSFCSEVLRQNAYRLDIPADFRIGEEDETLSLQVQAVEAVFEQAYEHPDEAFLRLVESHEFKRNQFELPNTILEIYKKSRCHCNPDKWLQKCADACAAEGISDASETMWGAYLIADLHSYLDTQISCYQKLIALAEADGRMPNSVANLQNTLSDLMHLRSLHRWDDVVACSTIDYGTLSFPKKDIDEDLRDLIKENRNRNKKELTDRLKLFTDGSDAVLHRLRSCKQSIHSMISLVNRFEKEYTRLKRSRRILDYSDLEHYAAELFCGKSRMEITPLAREVGGRYCEVMVDEYQDTNEVQDAIFRAITQQKNNCFMVGDVKQSIYQFRLADPTLFLQKYHEYVPAEDAVDPQGRKITLNSNFRSAKNILDAANDVFSYCMTPKIGGLYYGDEERLNEGMPHISLGEPAVEFYGIQMADKGYDEEAEFVAQRVEQLCDGTHYVRDEQGLRSIAPNDIAILLRTGNVLGTVFQKALNDRGIQVNSSTDINLLTTEEINFLFAFLQVINNPMQDIPLLTVLASRVFGFTADALAQLRANRKYGTVYDALCAGESEEATSFVQMLTGLRQEARHLSVSQLLDELFNRTKFDRIFGAFEDGAVRTANIRSFYQFACRFDESGRNDLTSFIEYIASLKNKGLRIPADSALPGAVTITTIHKSKGLEYPVVIIPALSKSFDFRDGTAPVLFDKDLGIGLMGVDTNKRITYPTLAKKGIKQKIEENVMSEEMRVLYVAMTRARDRLIMTYSSKNLEKKISNMISRMRVGEKDLLLQEATGMGDWVLISALRRAEAGCLFAGGLHTDDLVFSDEKWHIALVDNLQQMPVALCEDRTENPKEQSDFSPLKNTLTFTYDHIGSTMMPSKQTATQLKGRFKDQEAAEDAAIEKRQFFARREPSFINGAHTSSVALGNAVHSVMQHIDFKCCTSLESICQELQRLIAEKWIDAQMAESIDPMMLWRFFDSEIGRKLISADHVLREFKFSILDDATKYGNASEGDEILLQGVVDCAIIEDDGITVLDFKTDRVTEDTLAQVTDSYRLQVQAYANALRRIFGKEIQASYLYFFRISQFISV